MKICLSDYEPKDVIRIIREWTELSQEDFAKSINKHRRTIQQYESGKSRCYLDTLMLIAKIHNVKIIVEKK